MWALTKLMELGPRKLEGRGFNSHPGQSFPLSLCGPNSMSRANAHMVCGLKTSTSHYITFYHFNQLSVLSVFPLDSRQLNNNLPLFPTKSMSRVWGGYRLKAIVIGYLNFRERKQHVHNSWLFYNMSFAASRTRRSSTYDDKRSL